MKNTLVARSLMALAASYLCVTVLSGCATLLAGGLTPLGQVTLDTPRVEKEIADGIYEQLGVPVVVDCPDLMQGAPGDVRNCIATADDGSTVRVSVSIESIAGDITWFTE